jgi:multicomponent Na+:H+ antiporter subunit D
MTPEIAIALSMIIPLVGAVLIGLCDRWPDLRETVTMITAGALFATVVMILPHVAAGGRPELVLLELFPGLDLKFTVEPLGMLFALIASGLWIVTSVYAIGYMRGHEEENQTRFYTCFAIALAAAMGVAFSGNMLTLFICYEVLTLSTYPLVTHAGTEDAMRAGRVYLGILIGTSIGFLLLGIIMTWSIAGTLDFTQGGILTGKADNAVIGGLLLLYVFGIGKAALMPFHRWLPAAMVAPTPVSALLHAVAVVKAGVFSVLKVTVYIFGIDLLRDIDATLWLQYLAAATILISSLVAMTKDNLKARLAYSTISQLSYIVLGAMLVSQSSVIGGGMHIATHAFGKITLFFCAGAFMVAAHKTEISQLKGIGRVMPVTTGAFLIGSLSIIGLPPFGGLWSKWYLALGALEANEVIFVAVLMVSSLLNVAYLLPIPFRGFFSKADPPDHHDGHSEHVSSGTGDSLIREAPLPCLIAITVTSVGCIALFFFSEPIYELLKPIVAQ